MQNLKSHISKIKKAIRGFTLIETLVAVLLLATAITGPLTIAAKGLSAALIARDQMVAFYLAQEAVEYVRFVRDSNKLAATPWLTGLDSCTGTDGCTIDPLAGSVAACSGQCALIKKFNNGSGLVYFTYGVLGQETPQQFRRTVTLATPSTGELTETVLTVSVSWRAQSGVTRNISVRENLLDWQ